MAGGKGTRLYPLTAAVCKQLLPVYDKPMIYYPLSTLMLAGIRDIMIISSPQALSALRNLLGDGGRFGLLLTYAEQPEPDGIAQAFLIAEEFIDGDPVALILGDNIFYGNDLVETLRRVATDSKTNVIFGYYVNNPKDFGVVTLDESGKPVRLEEKPKNPESNWAVPGLYFYHSDVAEVARGLQPSRRHELEITDLNNIFLQRGELEVELLGRGSAWLDCGTPEALLDASEFIKVIEQRTGLKISCPEEIALRRGFVNRKQFESLSRELKDTSYGRYLVNLAKEI